MAERTVTSRQAFAGKLLKLRVDEVTLENGRTATREVVDHPGAVAILPWDGSRLALVRQWRYAAERELLEVPAGTRDPDEAPRLTAARELAEETQLAAATWVTGPAFFTAPGFCTEFLTVFLATDLSAATEGTQPDDEAIEIEWLTMSQALTAIDDGGIQDAKSIVAILWLARRLGAGDGIGQASD
jgi:ADP-ribose pyrophosphatase